MKKIALKVLVAILIISFISPIAVLAAEQEEDEPIELDNSTCTSQGVTAQLGEYGYDRSWGGYYYVELTIVNDSQTEIYFEVDYIIINGFQLPTLAYGYVYSGMENDIQVTIDPKDMELARIDSIQDVELGIQLFDSDDNNKRLDKLVVWRKTSPVEDSSTTEFVFEGKEVYNENGIRVLARLGENGEKAYPVVFYIENNSGKRIYVFYKDLAVNKKMVDILILGGPSVEDGAKTITGIKRNSLEFASETIPENSDINSISFKISFNQYNFRDRSISLENTFESNRIDVER